MRKLVVLATFAAALWLAPGALAAWCGSGENANDLPDVVTAQQVHVIVAVGSDAPDTFADTANQASDDVASMLSWWAGQDPTRVPRFDQADFNGTQCLDISFVHLPDPTARYAGTGATQVFEVMAQELYDAGFSNVFKKYLVYYVGATGDADVCGEGGGDLTDGPSYAIVFTTGCDGVPLDTVATHELLHALGAVPDGDPHCPSDPAHPCDSPTDVLYPYTSGEPLSQKVLDFNHDDYYAHSQPWPDVQDSLWLHLLGVAQVSLSIAFSGGTGTVVTDLPGPACTVACTTAWDPGAEVRLTAKPGTNDRFVRWTGSGCVGNDDCALTLSQSESVTAVYGPLRIPLKLSVAGKGRIACTPRCGTTFAAGNYLGLKAVPAKGWKFSGWSGACKGTRLTCAPATDYALTVAARFKQLPKKKKH